MKACAKSLCLLPLLSISFGNATAGTVVTTAGKTMPAVTVASADPATPPPQSVFVIPATPKEGRNPFFPHSKPDPTSVSPKPDPVEAVTFLLNGITSPPKRTAMINGRTFEPGESGDVKFPSGVKVSIQCLEIRDDAVIIAVGTQRRELRMRSGI